MSFEEANWLKRQNEAFFHKLDGINRQFRIEVEEWPMRLNTMREAQKPIPTDVELTSVSSAKYVGQGSYAVTAPNQPYIGTLGLGPCLGLILVGYNNMATVAHIDAISDGESFARQRLQETKKAYLLGGNTDTNLAFNILRLLESADIETVVSTDPGPSSFVYDANNDRLSTQVDRSNFIADWQKIDRKMSLPLGQADMLRKNHLLPC